MNTNNLKIPSLSDLGVSRQEHRLSNGIRVILFEIPHAPVCLRTSFLSGSRFDPTNKDGCAHFLEHMLLAGTKSFPRKELLALYMERLGGQIGATTGYDILKIDLSVAEASDIGLAINHLNEVLTVALFSDESVETERGSILKEIGISKSSLEGIVRQSWNEIIFQKTLLSRPILGGENSVEALSRDDLLLYYRNFITTRRASITISGGIKMNTLVELLEKDFRLSLSGNDYQLEKVDLPVIRERKMSLKYDSISEQAHLIFGFRTVSVFHDDVPILNFIAKVIGGGRSSLLVQKLRYERGLVYAVNARSLNIVNVGEFSLHTSTSAKHFSEVISVIVETIKDISKNGLPADLVSFKKEQLVKSLRVRFQTANDWVDGHSYYEAVGLKGKTVLDWTKEFNGVTNEDIIRVANRYFTNDNWCLAVAGKIMEQDVPEIGF